MVGPRGRAHAVAAEELEPGGGHRDREGEGGRVAARRQRRRRVDRQLVRERGQGRQDPRAPHHDTAGGLPHLVHRHLRLRRRHVAPRPVDGGMDEGVGQRPVVPGQELLVRDQVGRARLVAADRPLVRASRESGERHVHVVGRAAHDPHAPLRDPLEAAVAAREIGARARDQVAHVDRLAGLRIRHEADRRGLVLQVEERGHEARRAGERGMARDVAHALVAHPDLPLVAEALQKLLARACRHGVWPPILASAPGPAVDFVARAALVSNTTP